MTTYMGFLILGLILAMLAGTAITVARIRGIFVAVMLTGIYSLLSAAWMLVLDAPDVAFTEAAVGAGVSTVLMLSALALTSNREVRPDHMPLLPLVVVILTGGVLVYGTLGLPSVGDPDAPAHGQVATHYLEETEHEIHVPNIVTAVLASYRGYDTLGETAVIFTAGLGVVMILGGASRVLSWQVGEEDNALGIQEVDDFTAAPQAWPLEPEERPAGWDAEGQTPDPPGEIEDGGESREKDEEEE
jgi:multicomponent Na+:H+ antiporter subunit B